MHIPSHKSNTECHTWHIKYGPHDGLIWHIWQIWYIWHIWHMPQGSCGKSGHMLLVFSWQSRFFRKPILIPFILSRNIDKTFDIQLKMFQITSSSKFEKANHNYIRAVQRNTKVEIRQNLKQKEKWKMHNLKQGSGPDHKSYIFLHLLDGYWMHFRVFWKTVRFFSHSWYCLSWGGSASHFTRTFPLRV